MNHPSCVWLLPESASASGERKRQEKQEPGAEEVSQSEPILRGVRLEHWALEDGEEVMCSCLTWKTCSRRLHHHRLLEQELGSEKSKIQERIRQR
jgi:hypothetical protein